MTDEQDNEDDEEDNGLEEHDEDCRCDKCIEYKRLKKEWIKEAYD